MHQDTKDGARFTGYALLILLLIVLLGTGWWVFRVATSDVKGQGDALIRKNSATNRIGAQQRFEELYADILASDRRIDTLAADAAANPDSQVAQTNLTGSITYCQDVVADYNALARSYTAQDFRAYDLPAQIDNLNPATDCKESTTP